MAVAVSGFDELLGMLSQIESRVARKKILATAVRQALDPTLEAFREAAPDDFDTPGSRIVKHSRKAVLDQTSSSVLGKVGATVQGFVGYFHEWGTEHLTAQPFAQPAQDATIDRFVEILREYLWLGIVGELVEEGFDE